MTENEKIELFDKWYDENYDEWAEGEEGIALREELEQAFKSGIATLEKENAEAKERIKTLEYRCENIKDTDTMELVALQRENAELKEKFLKVKTDDVRKSKLDSFKTLEEKNEYLRQVANYAIFNEDVSVMFWCFVQRGDIYTEQLTKAKEIIEKLRALYLSPVVTKDDVKRQYEILAEAEQFLKE